MGRKEGRWEVGKAEKKLPRKSARATVLVVRGIEPTTVRWASTSSVQVLRRLLKTATPSLPPYLQNNYDKIESEFTKKLIRNPFNVKPKDLPDEFQEKVIELQNNSSFRDSFEFGVNMEESWCKIAISYRNIWRATLRHLIARGRRVLLVYMQTLSREDEGIDLLSDKGSITDVKLIIRKALDSTECAQLSLDPQHAAAGATGKTVTGEAD
uniref:Uncharacterized protein n=1 Tax=Timema bartmani TaxID=61472 RepID=A0A7R9EY55_9NEOP|nr:unnamed protein product [Timema bartmani]